MWIGWLIAVIILIILELITKGLVSLWFIISGVIALIVSFFVLSFYIQFLIFGALGIFLFIIVNPLLEKRLKKNNIISIIGKKGTVTKIIKKGSLGEVEIDGKIYAATSEKRIFKGKTVIVEKIEGEILVVNKE